MQTARFILPSVVFLALAFTLPAQSYKTAVGFRVDEGVNLTLQQHLFSDWTVEGILHTSIASRDLGITLLAEKHQKILFRGLNVYFGAGPHYYWKSDANRQENEIADRVAGLSVIGGAELSLGRFNVSVDLKPELHLSGDTVYPLEWNGAAVSVRYVLAKREKAPRKWKVWHKEEHKRKRF
jgi:hypothetical protein